MGTVSTVSVVAAASGGGVVSTVALCCCKVKVLVDIEGLEERLDEFDFGFAWWIAFYDLLYGLWVCLDLPSFGCV